MSIQSCREFLKKLAHKSVTNKNKLNIPEILFKVQLSFVCTSKVLLTGDIMH